MKPTTKTNLLIAAFFSLGLITGCNTIIATNQVLDSMNHMEVTE